MYMSKIIETIQASIDNFKLIVSTSNGAGEICRKYNFSDNGQSRNLIKKYILDYNIPTSHFGLKNTKIKYKFFIKLPKLHGNIQK